MEENEIKTQNVSQKVLDDTASTELSEIKTNEESITEPKSGSTIDELSDGGNAPNESIEVESIELHSINTVTNEDKDTKSKTTTLNSLFDFIELFVLTIVTVFVLTTLCFRHSVVEGGSMDKTLAEGDHLIISSLFYTPDHGDIVVCEDYSTGLKNPIVKRVIALSGETIKIDINGNVYINGELLEEEYVHIDGYLPYYEIEYTVPDGEVFVMGDHRNASTDSRDFGSVKVETILGKAVLRFYPFESFEFIN